MMSEFLSLDVIFYICFLFETYKPLNFDNILFDHIFISNIRKILLIFYINSKIHFTENVK